MVIFLPPNAPRVNYPAVIGDPSVPSGNSLTTWGIPVTDAPVPLAQLQTAVTGGRDPLYMWRTQPSIRKVVEFIARNCASVPWHAYIRVDDTDRQRVQTSPAEQSLMNPGRFTTGFKLWRDVVTDMCMYDAWCVVIIKDRLTRISPKLLQLETDALGNILKVYISTLAASGQNETQHIDITSLPLAISTGWSGLQSGGISPMTTLRHLLDEQQHAVEWRDSLWQNGPKTNGVLKRPATAPVWGEGKRDRFLQQWRAFRDSSAGGTPILEDGMEFETLDMLSPLNAQDLQGRQLADAEVASAFHVPPELVGARPGTFSNIAAFRQMLFGPVLGPRLEELQQAVNAEIVPFLDSREGVYVELDREAAMNGSFAEQAQILSTAIGGPWLTRNEGRSKQNLPSLPGGDEIITPLNVIAGGQASPQDSGSQNLGDGTNDPNAESGAPKSSPARYFLKAASVNDKAATLQEAITALYKQQSEAINRGEKVDLEAFHKQWDAIAAEAIHDHLFGVASESAQATLDAMKAPTDAWSPDVMQNYVRAMSEGLATKINAASANRINNFDWPDEPEAQGGSGSGSLFAALAGTAVIWAATAYASANGFGANDGANAAGAKTKTWVTGEHPRESHAAMDGETVPFDEDFSNGLRWPGDSMGEADETVSCNCGIEYTQA